MNAVTRASIEASVLTTLITQPIWVIKTRMLLNMNQKISEYENFKKQVSLYKGNGTPAPLELIDKTIAAFGAGLIVSFLVV